MRLVVQPEHEALRQELRQYYAKLLTPEIEDEIRRSEGVGPIVRKVVLQMGRDGWLGIGWPKEYGGQGLTPIEQFIFFDESMRAGAPVPMLTINSVAPTIMRYGTRGAEGLLPPEDPRAARSTSRSATPSPTPAPTSRRSRPRAVRDGDEYVINGQKIFTSLATDADYVWLAVRTDPEATKHKGISMIIVPTDTPGLHGASPSRTWATSNTNDTFYEDVRVPVGNLVGEENQGWKLITNQLNHERVTLCARG